ncbi:hypothetical protein CDL12_25976 [Handroanthus impetiginosus]|uniref:Uncharacterized protein n=1 Tax=Handroanthus impetiginosus TaxID=429701 RepID=A0A2G9G8A2_9LAMI|nr:hypothetical protein CDL12_25976 [Handroanthus impetiginosus]
MMNKKRLFISPVSSPTIDGMEMQPNTSPPNTQNATAPSRADPTTTTTTVSRLKTSIHVTALDGIVNVNSLFTMAIFIGFSLTVPEAATATSRPECTTSRETVRRLIVFEVVSFSFFLYSSLIAQSLKLAINLLNNMDPNDPHKADIDPDYLKYGLFGSAIGSVVGCSFLMLSIVDFIQVKLGAYSCGGKPVYAVVTLVVFVGFGLAVYVSTAIYASFFVEISSKDNTTPQKQKS